MFFIIIKNFTQLISAQDLKKGENYLKEKFGLNKNDKFVCITVRDNEYLKKEFPNIVFLTMILGKQN